MKDITVLILTRTIGRSSHALFWVNANTLFFWKILERIIQLNDDFGEIMNLYSGFIGKEHFTSLVRLLGYSGIALTIKGCILPNSKTLLKNTILVYFKSLQVRFSNFLETCFKPTSEITTWHDSTAESKLWHCSNIYTHYTNTPRYSRFLGHENSSFSLFSWNWQWVDFCPADWKSTQSTRNAWYDSSSAF